VCSVIPFGVFVYQQLRVGRHRPGSDPLVWFAWASEILPEDRRAVLVELSLSVVFSLLPGASTLRFSGLRVERPGREQRKRCGVPGRSTSLVLGRHYRV
jgi:hypothetical protein